MRPASLLGFTLATCAWLGCEAIAGLGDFGPEPATNAGGGGTAGTGGGEPTQPQAEFSNSFGSSSEEKMGGVGIDAVGHVYLAGTHQGTLTIFDEHTSAVADNPFVAQLDSGLTPLWSRSFDVDEDVTVYGATSDSGGRTTFVGGIAGPIDFGSGLLSPSGMDVYVAQLSDVPQLTQAGVWGSEQIQFAYAVVATGAGATVGGVFRGYVDFDPPNAQMDATDTDGFIVRFDSGGQHDWSSQIGGAGKQDVRGLSANLTESRIYVTGIHDQVGSINGVSLPYDGDGSYDAFVLVIDSETGEPVSPSIVKTYSDGGNIVTRAIVERDDAVLLVGDFDDSLDLGGGDTPYASLGGKDVFVAKLDTDLNTIWSRHYGAAGEDRALACALDGDGNAIVVGDFEGSVDFGAGLRTASGKDAFILKLDADGNHVWSGAYGAQGNDTAVDVVVEWSTDSIVVVGDFYTAIDFGNGALTSVGSTDLFVAKFAPNPPMGPP